MAIRRLICLLVLVGFAFTTVACAGNQVRSDDVYPDDPNFMISDDAEIADTEEVREVLDVLYQYREAMVSKDFGALTRMASRDYYDNAGTTHTTEDDYGYDELADIFELMAQYAQEVQYEILVKDVVVDDHRAHVDYQFEYAYQYRMADQDTWDAGIDVNRMEFQREDDRWMIISGM